MQLCINANCKNYANYAKLKYLINLVNTTLDFFIFPFFKELFYIFNYMPGGEGCLYTCMPAEARGVRSTGARVTGG